MKPATSSLALFPDLDGSSNAPAQAADGTRSRASRKTQRTRTATATSAARADPSAGSNSVEVPSVTVPTVCGRRCPSCLALLGEIDFPADAKVCTWCAEGDEELIVSLREGTFWNAALWWFRGWGRR